jgi:hypothetical protein
MPDPRVAEALAHELLERLRPIAKTPWGAEAFNEAKRIACEFLVEALGPDERIAGVVAKHCRISEERVAFDVRAILEELTAEPEA